MKQSQKLKSKLIIISAPSGAGKSTLCSKLVHDYPEIIENISYTTRPPRNQEKHGVDYFFISKDEFDQKIAQKFFIEWAEVHGNFYGISVEQIDQALAQGNPIIFDIDVQGARTLLSKYKESLTFFILPPSIEELRRRLKSRDSGRTQNFELRIQNAEKEIKEATFFDYKIINANLDESYRELKKIVEKELQPS